MLFQRFQPGNHRLDPGTCLLVLGQQRGALAHQLFLLLAKAAVLLTEATCALGQLLDTVGQGLQSGEEFGVFHGGHDSREPLPVKGAAGSAGRPRDRGQETVPTVPTLVGTACGIQARMNDRQLAASSGLDSQ